MNLLLALTILALFTPFQAATPLVVVRPFDLFVPVLFLTGLAHINTLRRDHDWTGFLVLLPYLACHVLSAFTLSEPNGVREGLQAATIVMFALALVLLRDAIRLPRLAGYLLVGLFAVMLYNAGYHIAIGATGGWKTLGDAKLSMTFLPVVLAVFMLVRPGWRVGTVLWLVTGGVILLSGERKALVAFALLSALVFGRGRIVTMAVVLAVAVQAVQFFALATSNAYLSRQIDTLFNITGGQDTSVSALLAGGGSESLSNAQRVFALRVSEDLFAQNPFFGAGTNAYVNHIQSLYPTAPNYLRVGIHGEFQRITVENGLVGLGLYLAIFVVTGARLISLIRALPLVAARTYTLVILAILMPSLLSLSLEAGATRSLVILTVLALLPDFMRRVAETQGLLRPGLPPRAMSQSGFNPSASSTSERFSARSRAR